MKTIGPFKKPESIFILRRIDNKVICENPTESYGMTMDRLLELVMDDVARPAKNISEQLDNLFQNISRKEFKDALNIVNELRKEIPTDPDLIQAEILLHKKVIVCEIYNQKKRACQF